MSIIGQTLPAPSSAAPSPAAPTAAVPATLPATVPVATREVDVTGIVLLPMLLVAVVIAYAAGVFRRRSIDGPVRLPSDSSAAPLLLITVAGGAVWMLAQVGYITAQMTAWQRAHPGQRFDVANLGPDAIAFVAVVPALLGLIVLLAGDRFARPPLHRLVGYAPANLFRGVLAGLVALPVVLPVVYVCSFVLELLYRAFRFEHPTEHELLTVMKDAPGQVRWMLVAGAAVVAPVFEEFLFRGHLQTLLVRMFTRPSPRPQLLSPDPPPPPPLPSDDTRPPDAPPPLEPVSPPRPLRWMAVIVTSLIFASVHPSWMAPLIFVLSVGLGYLYERTGSLWAPITVHAVFNASQTAIFLMSR